MDILIHRDGQQYGPYTLELLQEYVSKGTLIPATDLAWYEGMGEWLPLKDVLLRLTPAAPPTPQPSGPPVIPILSVPSITGSTETKAEPNQKTFWIAFVLCLLLGFFGAHRFYLGKKSAWVMLVTFGFCGIWWLIDIILLLASQFTDKNKIPVVNPKPAVSWPIAAVWILIVFANGGDKPHKGTSTLSVNASTASDDKSQADANETTKTINSKNSSFMPYFGTYEGTTDAYSAIDKNGRVINFNGKTVDIPTVHVKLTFSKIDGGITMIWNTSSDEVRYSGVPILINNVNDRIKIKVQFTDDSNTVHGATTSDTPVYDFEFRKGGSCTMEPTLRVGEPKTELHRTDSPSGSDEADYPTNRKHGGKITQVIQLGGRILAIGTKSLILSCTKNHWVICNTPDDGDLNDVAFGHGSYVITTDRDALASRDAFHWEKVDLQLNGYGANAICYFNNHFFAYNMLGYSSQSVDGFTWKKGDQTDVYGGIKGGMVIFQNQLFAIYEGMQGKGLLVSKDGIAFSGIDMPLSEIHLPGGYDVDQDLSMLVVGNNQLVAMATYGSIFTSHDGKTWIKHQLDQYSHPDDLVCVDLVACGDTFYLEDFNNVWTRQNNDFSIVTDAPGWSNVGDVSSGLPLYGYDKGSGSLVINKTGDKWEHITEASDVLAQLANLNKKDQEASNQKAKQDIIGTWSVSESYPRALTGNITVSITFNEDGTYSRDVEGLLENAVHDDGVWKIDDKSIGVIDLSSNAGPSNLVIPNGMCSFPDEGKIRTGLAGDEIVLSKE
jgi:hypothetical protein